MDELLRDMEKCGEPQFENFKDIDIPKRLKITIEEGLSILMTCSNKKVAPFVHDSNE